MIFFLIACEEPTTVNIIYPELVITDSQVDFAEVEVETNAQYSLSILNSGAGPLRISSITTEDYSDNYELSLSEVELNADELTLLDITFQPTEYREYNTQLIIESNDKESPTFSLPIFGFGGDGPTPDIKSSLLELDFGSTAAGEKKNLYFTVSNIGDGVLEISGTDQSGSGSFSLIGDLDNQNLSPQVETGLLVEYAPFHENGDSGVLTIHSNDPDQPELSIAFTGNGGGEESYPVADIECPTSVNAPSDVYLSGSNSNDPSGQLLQYEWTIEKRPSTSQAELVTPADSQTYINVDVAGDYQVNLRVQNQDGTFSPPAECLFYAQPPADIHVELSWDEDNSDMDLHMMRQSDALFSLEDDCCWCNPNPSWAGSENPSNPILSVDSDNYTTPEVIDVWSAEDIDYHLSVHYFSDLGVGQTTATIRIYLSGVLEGQYSQEMIHNQVWDLGYIRWSTGYFINSHESPTAYLGPRSCQ